MECQRCGSLGWPAFLSDSLERAETDSGKAVTEVKAYIEAHGMTMGEFIAQAVDNELHPKIQITVVSNEL